ncbi:M66 family metalloprotease [Vibrio sp. AND4]|uniref:M66 family metalloprotease n=1 Tax=Vibrio sp. AND4 TaxID=314289 RepID=UPI00015F34AA|nr:M66 family metalloprotease [Vibrio sp. AND4]EDP59636.1 TagA-related protein [Vibrio sp. AND4]
MIKKALLASAIGALLPAYSATADEDIRNTMMQEMAKQIEARVEQVNQLAQNPDNWEEHNGKNFFRLGEYLYAMTPDHKPIFMPFVLGSSHEENAAYADRSAEAMFDFVKAPWRLTNEFNGVYVYHDQFGQNYLEWIENNKRCSVRYLADGGVNTTNQDCKPFDEKQTEAIGFIDDQDVTNHLAGTFKAQVRFVQNQISEPYGNTEKSQQKLITHREALLVITPEKESIDEKNILAYIYKDGQLLEKRVLSNPSQLLSADRTVEDERPDILYSKRSYSTVLPWNYVENGLSLRFETYDMREGELAADSIEFGPPTHLEMPMVRVGMLTEPPAAKPLETRMANYGSELFQRLPLASMSISPYLPVKLDKVVTAYGEVEQEYSQFEKPDIHSGDLRENITKSLIQTGINNANFGVPSTAGTHQWQPAHFPTVVIGHSIGRYLNKKGEVVDVTHGASGGNGMVLLVDSTGNEVTHEIGHAFSLWHYPGGPDVYYHSTTSGWGYDAYRGRMADNVVWYNRGYDGRDFKGLVGYQKDPMAGGNFDSNSNNYPLFTGYTSKVAQDYLATYDLLDMSTESGFTHWDESAQTMLEVKETSKRKPRITGVDVVTTVGYYDPTKQHLSHIYPPMYGASGNVFDLPEPQVGQCWAEITYANGKFEQVALDGHRLDRRMSNKFHINLERSAEPESLAVFCPERLLEDIVREAILADVGQEHFFDWDDNKQKGNPGDMFRYHRNGRIELFELQTHRYWYFPDSGQSNHQWKFIGYLDELIDQYVAEQQPSFEELGKVKLTTRQFEVTDEYPQRTVTFGKDHDGYALGVEDSPTFAQIKQLTNADYSSVAEFERAVLTQNEYQRFGQHSSILSAKQIKAGFIGALFSHRNPDSGTLDYFMMKRTNAGAMPIDKVSNQDWKYLGDAETYVNFDLNPIRVERKGLDHDARLKAYYRVEEILSAEQAATTNVPFQLFKSSLKGGQQGYFLQKSAGDASEMPTDEFSNSEWHFIASDHSLDETLTRWLERDEFEQDVANWYRQEKLRAHGETGEVGDIYLYDFHDGKRHYYQLKNDENGYFPWPDKPNMDDWSNHNWQYLTSF